MSPKLVPHHISKKKNSIPFDLYLADGVGLKYQLGLEARGDVNPHQQQLHWAYSLSLNPPPFETQSGPTKRDKGGDSTNQRSLLDWELGTLCWWVWVYSVALELIW